MIVTFQDDRGNALTFKKHHGEWLMQATGKPEMEVNGELFDCYIASQTDVFQHQSSIKQILEKAMECYKIIDNYMSS